MQKAFFSILFIGFISSNFIACKKSLDFNRDYFGVEEVITSKDVCVPCGQTVPIEGQEVRFRGKLSPDFYTELTSYDPNFPDTWTSHIRVIDDKLKDGRETSNYRTTDKQTAHVTLKNDGTNLSSFEPLKDHLLTYLSGEEYQIIKVKATVRSYDAPTNGGCTKKIYFVIDSEDDIILE